MARCATTSPTAGIDATDAEVEDAARRANAHEFIVRLPEQYETFIGERGVKLSGGQCQRLAIARAILASPQILILDEATSNLDTESEQLIQASMATLLAGRTTFVIAHRLSTIRRADLILLLEDGRVIERGTHDELMDARGVYYRMVLRQMQSAVGGWRRGVALSHVARDERTRSSTPAGIPTPGIVSVWADGDGRAVVWRASRHGRASSARTCGSGRGSCSIGSTICITWAPRLAPRASAPARRAAW